MLRKPAHPRPEGTPHPLYRFASARPVTEDPQAAGWVPHADRNGTIIACVGCVLTGLGMQGDQPSELGHFAAYGMGISIALSLFCDFRAGGFRNLIRADAMALVAFYFLTFFEFLFPQPAFDTIIVPDSARRGIYGVLLGAISLMIGRHLLRPRKPPLERILTTQTSPWALIAIFWACFAVGYIHMLLAVNFDVMAMLNAFMGPRFSQPWTRGRLGDWKALLVELGMFIYLLPPLAGIMLARRERYPGFALLLVSCGLLFTLFFGFSSGTRNILAAYMVTLLIAYAFAAPVSRRKELLTLGILCVMTMVVVAPLMLAFRNMGLKRWLETPGTAPIENGEAAAVFVDYNLFSISRLMEVFPSQRDYLGLEIPYNALIRPIPRAIWPSKPEGLTFSIEDAMGVQGLTISATFVGEAYMAEGMVGVAIAGLLLGALFGWWNHLGAAHNSEFGILIYASGFFCAIISMRSLFVFTTALMPTLAAIVFTTLLVKQVVALEARLAQARERRARAGIRLPPERKR